MTVKEFSINNNLSVDVVLNLCKKLGINVSKKSDILSDDDQILLEYEIEELVKANNGGGDAGGKSSGGADFDIDNVTFTTAYICLNAAINSLDKGLGNFNELDARGLSDFGEKTTVGGKEINIDNGNRLSAMSNLCENLKYNMIGTMKALSRISYENANYFKKVLGGRLENDFEEFNDFLNSDEVKKSKKIGEFYDLFNKGEFYEKDEFGNVVKDEFGNPKFDVDAMDVEASKLGLTDVASINDFINKSRAYNEFFVEAEQYVNSISPDYGLDYFGLKLSDMVGLGGLAAQKGLSDDSSIQSFIKKLEINNEKVKNEEDKLEFDGLSREDYAYRNEIAKENGCENYWEYSATLESDKKDSALKVSQYGEERFALETDASRMTQIAIEKLKEEQKNDPYYMVGSSLDERSESLVLGYTYEMNVEGNTVKRFVESVEQIPSQFRVSVQEYTFEQVKSTDEGVELYNKVNEIYSNRDGTILADYSSISSSISRKVERVNNRLINASSNYTEAYAEYSNVLNEQIILVSPESSLGAFNFSRSSCEDFEKNSVFSESARVDAIKILENAINNDENIEFNEHGERVYVLDEEAYTALYMLHINENSNDTNSVSGYGIKGNYLVTPEGDLLLYKKVEGVDLNSVYKVLDVAKTGDSGVKNAFTVNESLSIDSTIVSQKNQEFIDKNYQSKNIVDVSLGLINGTGIRVSADGEYSKYIFNDLVNETGKFYHNGTDGKIGTKVWYFDNDGHQIFVESTDLKTAIINRNMEILNGVSSTNTSSLLNSEMWTSNVTNVDYSSHINYIYNTSSVENRASNIISYVNDISPILDERWVTRQTEIDTNYANNHPGFASIGSVVLSGIEGLKTLSYVTEHIGSEYPYFKSATYSIGDTMRSQVSTNLRYSGTATAEFDGFMYDVGMSRLDSLFLSPIPGGTGLWMALGSIDNNFNDAMSRGVDPEMSLVYSMSLAALEALTEQMSIDHFMKVTKGVGKVSGLFTGENIFVDIPDDGVVDKVFNKLIKEYVSKFAGNNVSTYTTLKGVYAFGSQSFSEGVEEYVSSVGGRIIDNYLNSELSANNIALTNYINQGYTNEQALEMVLSSNNEEDFMSFLSGFVSGSFSGPVYIINNSGQNAKYMNALELAEYSGDYGLVVDYFLNSKSTPVIANVQAATISIDSLYNAGKIDLATRTKLDTMVREYHVNNSKTSSDYNLLNEISKEIEYYNIALNSLMRNKLNSKGVNTDNMSFEDMKTKYKDLYEEVAKVVFGQDYVVENNDTSVSDIKFDELAILGEMQSRLELMGESTDGLTLEDMKDNYGDLYKEVYIDYMKQNLLDKNNVSGSIELLIDIFVAEGMNRQNFKSENIIAFNNILNNVIKKYSSNEERTAELIYAIIKNKMFGNDSENVALRLMNMQSNISSDQVVLSSLVSSVGLVGLNQEQILAYMNHQDLSINDIVDGEDLNKLTEQEIAKKLLIYLDEIVKGIRGQNNLSDEQQLRQEHFSEDKGVKEDKRSIRKDSTSDEEAATSRKNKDDGSSATEINPEIDALNKRVNMLKYKVISVPSYIKEYLASNVRKFMYKNTNRVNGLNQQIMENGLYHFTESADGIIESGYIKTSGVNASYGNRKVFFFNGVPSVGAVATNLDNIPIKATAVKVIPTTDIIESSKLKIRYVDDMAISYDGRFNLDGMQCQKVYFGLTIENDELVYKEITQEEYSSYEKSNVGKVLTEYLSDKKNIRDIKGSFLTDIANRNKELGHGEGSKLFDNSSNIDSKFSDDYTKNVDLIVDLDSFRYLVNKHLESYNEKGLYSLLSSEYFQNKLSSMHNNIPVENLKTIYQIYAKIDSKYDMSIELGQYIESLISDENNVIGIHRTSLDGDVLNSSIAYSILTDGLRNMGHLSSGHVDSNPDVNLTVSFEDMLDMFFMLKGSYKGSKGSFLLSFPIDKLNSDGSLKNGSSLDIYDYIDGIPHIKSEYILGYVECSDDGTMKFYSKEDILSNSKFNKDINIDTDLDLADNLDGENSIRLERIKQIDDSGILGEFASFLKERYGDILDSEIEDLLNFGDLDTIDNFDLNIYETEKITSFLKKLDSLGLVAFVRDSMSNGIINNIIDKINDKNLLNSIFGELSLDAAKGLFSNMSVDNIKYVINSTYSDVRLKFLEFLKLSKNLNIDVTSESIINFLNNSDETILSYYDLKYKDFDFLNRENIDSFLQDIDLFISGDVGIDLSRLFNLDSISSLKENVYLYEKLFSMITNDKIPAVFRLLNDSTARQLLLSKNIDSDIKNIIKQVITFVDISVSDIINGLKNGDIKFGVDSISLTNGRNISINEIFNLLEKTKMLYDVFDSIAKNRACLDDISNAEILESVVELFNLLYNSGYNLKFENANLLNFYEFYNKYLKNVDSNTVQSILQDLVADNSSFSAGSDAKIYKSRVKVGADQHAISNVFNPFSNDNQRKIASLLIDQVVKKFPGMSRKLAVEFLRRIDVSTSQRGTGGICNYADVANLIFEYYNGKPRQFEEKFGFPMYHDGHLNDAQLLCDMFINISDFLIKNVTENDGSLDVIASDDKYLINNVRYFNLFGTIFDSYQIPAINTYLQSKGIISNNDSLIQYNIFSNLDGEESLNWLEKKYLTNKVKSSIQDAIKNGKHVSVVCHNKLDSNGNIISEPFKLYEVNDRNFERPLVKIYGAHIMSIYKIEGNRVFLDSWGHPYCINIDDMISSGVISRIDVLHFSEEAVSNLEVNKNQFIEKYSNLSGEINIKELQQDIIDYDMSLDELFQIENIRKRFNDSSFIELFGGMSNKEILKILLDERNSSFVSNNLSDMEFLAQVIFSSDYNEISSLMKLFNPEKIAQLFTNIYEDADIGDIINLIDDIDVLVDIFSYLPSEVQLSLFSHMSFEIVEIIAMNTFSDIMFEKYTFFHNICKKNGIKISVNDLVNFLSNSKLSFINLFQNYISKLDMNDDANIKLLQEFILISGVPFSEIINFYFISLKLNDYSFVSKLLNGLDFNQIKQIISGLDITQNKDINIFDNIINNLSDARLSEFMNLNEESIGLIYFIASRLDNNRLGSLLSNNRLNMYIKKSIFYDLSFERVSSLISNGLININGKNFGNHSFRMNVNEKGISSKTVFSLLSSDTKIEELLNAIKNGNQFSSEYSNEALFSALCVFSKYYQSEGFYFNFSSSSISAFYNNICDDRFTINDIPRLYSEMGNINSIENIFPGGVIQVNALGKTEEKNVSTIRVIELVNLLRLGNEKSIKMSLRKDLKNYNIYRAAFNKLYQEINKNDNKYSNMNSEMFELLRKISEQYTYDLKSMYDECERLKRVNHTYEKISLNGIVYCIEEGFDRKLAMKTIEKINGILDRMPTMLKKATKEIYFNNFDNTEDAYWKFVYDNGSHYSAATAGDGNIYIYKKSLLNDLVDERILYHESAHNLDRMLGKISEKSEWKKAMQSDNGYVSDYARNSVSEDFAESVTDYLIGVYTGNIGLFSKKFPNRGRIINEIISRKFVDGNVNSSNGNLLVDSLGGRFKINLKKAIVDNIKNNIGTISFGGNKNNNLYASSLDSYMDGFYRPALSDEKMDSDLTLEQYGLFGNLEPIGNSGMPTLDKDKLSDGLSNVDEKISMDELKEDTHSRYEFIEKKSRKKESKILTTLYNGLLKGGFVINESSSYKFKNSPTMILGSIRNAITSNQVYDVMKHSNLEILTSRELIEVIDIALSKGWNFDIESDKIRSNPEIIMHMFNLNPHKFVSGIHKYDLDNLSENEQKIILGYILQGNYDFVHFNPGSNFILRSNPELIMRTLNSKYVSDSFLIKYIDSYMDLRYLNESQLKELIIKINKAGYVFNENSSDILKQNYDFLLYQFENNFSKMSYLIGNVNFDNMSDEQKIKLLDISFKNGYNCSRLNETMILFVIDNYRNNDDIMKRLVNNLRYFDYSPETVVKILETTYENKNYRFNLFTPFDCFNMITSNTVYDRISSFDDNYRKKLNLIIERIGTAPLYVYGYSGLFNQQVIDTFGVDGVVSIFKYCSLNELDFDFDSLIINNKFSVFVDMYKKIFNINSFSGDFDITIFKSFLEKYLDNSKFFDEVMKRELSQEDIELLRKYVKSNFDVKISSYDELCNYNNILNEYVLNIINNASFDKLRDVMSLMIFNLKYVDASNMFEQLIDHSRINALEERLDEYDDLMLLSHLHDYYRLFKGFKDIIYFDNLKEMAKRIYDNTMIHKSRFNIYDNMTTLIKTLYGKELNQSLTKLNDVEMNQHNVRKNGEFTVEIKLDDGSIVKRDVDYIKINSNYRFLQHTMNAYSEGAKISDYKNPRLIGKSYLCLSLIGDGKAGVYRYPGDMDHVTLLFDKIRPSDLLLLGKFDIYSHADNNSLEVTSNIKSKFDVSDNVIRDTIFYNEYVIYRDNAYPSGILVTGLAPNLAEKQAAAYLGVPLVKVNRVNSFFGKTNSSRVSNIDFDDGMSEFTDYIIHGNSVESSGNDIFENYPSMMEDSLYDQEELQIEEDEIYYVIEDKLFDRYPDGVVRTNALGTTTSNIDVHSININTLLNVVRYHYDEFMSGNFRIYGANYNVYRAAINQLYEYLVSGDVDISDISVDVLNKLRSISESYILERSKMMEEVNRSVGSLKTVEYDKVVLDNGIEVVYENDTDMNPIIEKINSIFDKMPGKLKNATKKIVLNSSNSNPGDMYWGFVYGVTGFKTAASAGSGTESIILYKDMISKLNNSGNLSLSDERRIYHETAHNFDEAMGNVSSSDEWNNAVKEDGNYPSNYAKNGIREDFAESVAEYFMNKDQFNKNFPNRAKVLEQLFSDEISIQNNKKNNLNSKNAKAFTYSLKNKLNNLINYLKNDVKFSDDRVDSGSYKVIDGFITFSKDFDLSLKQMGEYFGDAGINNSEFGKKINKLFLECKTVNEIMNQLDLDEKLLFLEFLGTDHGKYLSKLNTEEIKSLIVYTGNGYNKVNTALQNGKLEGKVLFRDSVTGEKEMIPVETIVKNIDSAIRKAGGVKEDSVYYRGVSGNIFLNQNNVLSEAFKSIQDKRDVNEIFGVLRNFTGFSFEYSGYVSASPGYNTSYAKRPGFPIVLEILTPEGTNGAYINQVSKKYNVENEFLYARDVSFKILDVQLVDGMGDVNGADKVVIRCIAESKIEDTFTVEESISTTTDVITDAIEFTMPFMIESSDSDLEYYDDSVFGEDDVLEPIGLTENVFLDEASTDRFSIQLKEDASRLFNKSVSELTVKELEDCKIVVKTADEILKSAPEGFFKDDIQRDEFLFGVPDDVDTGSKFSASTLRIKFLDAMNNGSLVGVIDTFTQGELDSLKVAGFYKIIYAINQFVEKNGIVVEDGVLPIKQIAAKDPAYFEGGKDLILFVLADDLKQAEGNRDRITGVLSEIAALNNGTLRGLDKALKSEDSASRKVYNSWLEALEDAGYTVELGKDVIDGNGNIRLIGIKDFNRGQSFVITPDGTVLTSDLKNYGVDKKGNVVNISFSDFIPNDLLRYTIISDSSNYMDTLLNSIRLLEAKGYEIISSNLSWPGSFYKGVNLTLREKTTSQVFELQFHTETSFYAKNEGTHDFYEVKRNKLYNDGSKSSHIQNVADYAQILVESNVEVPSGAEKLGVISKFVKYLLKSGKNIDLTRMNEIISKVKEINSMYDSKTDAYKDAMKALINSVSIEGEFSFGEFLSKYLKIDTVSSMDGRTGVVSSEIVSDTGDSSWVEDEDFGIEDEDSDGYKLKDGERLGGRIGMQFFGGTLNNNDSQLPLFSKLIESIGNNDLFQQVLEQIKNLKETDLIGFKTLDEYKEYIIDYFISINFDGLTPRQFWLLTTDKFMLKKLIGTEVLNKFILDYYERAYVNLAETFNLLDAKSINQIFNNPVIKDYIMGLSADVFTKSINAFCEYSNYTWLQCDTFVEKIMDMSYDELYIFMEKTNWKKEKLIKMVFDSRDYESCLKLLHFIENKCLNVEALLEHPEFRVLVSDFYPYVYENEELLRMYNKQNHIKDEFESKIISLLNENLDDVLLSDGYRIANLDTHSVYVVKYELNGNIMQWEILTENKNYINMRYAIDKNDIYKAIVSKNFKLLSIQKDEFASKLCLSSENGLVEGINKLRLKINGIEKQILVIYSGYGDINLSDRFGSVSLIEIIDVKSVESKNVILDDGIGMYEITYIENGTLNKTYLTPTHKSLWDEDYVLKIDDYFIENNIVNATDIQIRKVDMQEIDFSSLDISKYSSSYDIFTNNKYGGNQSDVRKLVIDFINGTEINFVSSEKAKTMLNLIDKYFPNSSDIDKVNLVVAFEQVGCGYIAIANAFCTYMGSLENGFEIFKEKLGFDLYILENGRKYFNVEAVAFDILCSQFISQDIKLIINENKIEGVNGLNFVVMMKNYFNDKSIFVKASTGNYIKNKNETKINLLSGNFFPSKSSFKILSASNFDMELMSLGDNSFTSNDGSLNNTEIVGKVIEGIGGHAMIVTGVDSDGELIVSSWNKKYKFISESIDKYIRQGQKSEASVWTIEFDIGE